MIELDTTPEERASQRLSVVARFKSDFYKQGLEILEDAVGHSMTCDNNGNFEYQGLKGKIFPHRFRGGTYFNIINIKITHNCVERFFNWRKLRFEKRIVQKESCCLTENDAKRILIEHNQAKEFENENTIRRN